MKNKKWLGGGLVLLLVAAVLFFVYRKYSSDEYLKALPSRPKALVAVDVARLADASGMDTKELKEIFPKEWLETRTGINWTKKIYAFVSSKEYLGVLAAVSDAGDLENFLQELSRQGRCRAVEKRMGYSWTVFNERWLMGFDGHALLIMGPGYGGDMNVMRQEILGCFRQNEEESGMVSGLYKSLAEKDAALSVITRMDMLPESCHGAFLAGLPEHANLNDIHLMATVDFKEDGVEIEGELSSANTGVNKYYEQLSHIGGRMSGVYAENVPEDALAWGCVNVNGKSLLEQLRNIPEIRTFLLGLNMGVDADQMIRSINGDMAVTLLAPEGMSHMDYLMTARIENSDFLKEAGYWTQSAARNSLVTLDDLGDNRFFISTQDLKAYFGVDGETLYLASDEKYVPKGNTRKTATLSAWEEDVKSGCFFFWLNLEQLKKEPEMGALIMALNGSSWKETVDLFGSVTLRSSDIRHLKLNINTKEKQPVLGELLKQWIK